MQKKYHHHQRPHSVGYLPAAYFIIITAIIMAVWAFGSYYLYTVFEPSARICFPPLHGCVPVSRAGESFVSGVFFRATVLPASSLLAISFWFGIQFLKHISPHHLYCTRTILFILGVVLCPFFLIICEAILNGTVNNPLEEMHEFYAKLAFLTPLLFQIIYSITLSKNWKHPLPKMMIILTLLSLVCLLLMFRIIPVAIPRFGTMMAWNLLITFILWVMLMGISVKTYFSCAQLSR
ncbi:MAG: hypothetical protein OXC48_07815 [Endozoicomonadaceae bacterium]|nr:hypothetical protein [Endozoicomonadaceae bacterium]